MVGVTISTYIDDDNCFIGYIFYDEDASRITVFHESSSLPAFFFISAQMLLTFPITS